MEIASCLSNSKLNLSVYRQSPRRATIENSKVQTYIYMFLYRYKTLLFGDGSFPKTQCFSYLELHVGALLSSVKLNCCMRCLIRIWVIRPEKISERWWLMRGKPMSQVQVLFNWLENVRPSSIQPK